MGIGPVSTLAWRRSRPVIKAARARQSRNPCRRGLRCPSGSRSASLRFPTSFRLSPGLDAMLDIDEDAGVADHQETLTVPAARVLVVNTRALMNNAYQNILTLSAKEKGGEDNPVYLGLDTMWVNAPPTKSPLSPLLVLA